MDARTKEMTDLLFSIQLFLIPINLIYSKYLDDSI